MAQVKVKAKTAMVVAGDPVRIGQEFSCDAKTAESLEAHGMIEAREAKKSESK